MKYGCFRSFGVSDGILHRCIDPNSVGAVGGREAMGKVPAAGLEGISHRAKNGQKTR